MACGLWPDSRVSTVHACKLVTWHMVASSCTRPAGHTWWHRYLQRGRAGLLRVPVVLRAAAACGGVGVGALGRCVLLALVQVQQVVVAWLTHQDHVGTVSTITRLACGGEGGQHFGDSGWCGRSVSSSCRIISVVGCCLHAAAQGKARHQMLLEVPLPAASQLSTMQFLSGPCCTQARQSCTRCRHCSSTRPRCTPPLTRCQPYLLCLAAPGLVLVVLHPLALLSLNHLAVATIARPAGTEAMCMMYTMESGRTLHATCRLVWDECMDGKQGCSRCTRWAWLLVHT